MKFSDVVNRPWKTSFKSFYISFEYCTPKVHVKWDGRKMLQTITWRGRPWRRRRLVRDAKVALGKYCVKLLFVDRFTQTFFDLQRPSSTLFTCIVARNSPQLKGPNHCTVRPVYLTWTRPPIAIAFSLPKLPDEFWNCHFHAWNIG